MDNSKTVHFDVDDGPDLLQVRGYLKGLRSHDVMHCFDGDAARQTCV
jgi:hypothetical protein